MAVRKIKAGRVSTVTMDQFVGEQGTIFYEDTTGEMRVSNGVDPGGNVVSYVLPVASNVILGGIKLGTGFAIDANGVASVIGDGGVGTSANLIVYDHGTLVTGNAESINFIGASITSTGSDVTVTITGNNVLSNSDRLVSGNAQVVLNSSGPEPYLLFPAASDGQQLQLSQAEISSIAGNLALTSAEHAYVITNGSGAAPGGAKNWKFDRGGNLTLPNNAVIKDTATNSISFGLRAGDSGQGTLTVAIGSQAGEINQGLQSTALGSYAGNYNQGIGTVAIGTNAGAFNQGLRAVAIGGLAGAQNQGEYAVALGNFAGGTNQPNNSIIINASGVALNGSASGLFIDPIREVAGTKIVYYNPSTKEITIGPIGLTSNNNISITSNNNVWTFSTDGGLRTPDNQLTVGGYTIQASNNNEIDLANGPDVTIRSNVGGVAIGADWAGVQSEWVFSPNGNLELPNGTRIRDIGTIGSASGLELGNNGFRINFGSPVNDWAIFSGARLMQFDPDETFNINFGEQGWQFANTGNITFPDGTIHSGKTVTAPAEQDFTITLQHDMLSGDGLEPYSFVASHDKITLPTRNGRILVGPGNSGNEWSLDAANKNLFFPNGDRILYDGNVDLDGSNYGLHLYTYTKPVLITSGQTESWTFDTNGNLILPQTAMDVSPAPVSWPGITFSDGTFQNTAYTGGGGAASTVDVTNTNGLTTIYYPTFVESRTNGQYMRADVDLTYRTDTNTLTAGNMATGVLKIEDGVHEKFQTKSYVTGTVEHDCSGGHIFYHQTPSANWTVNLTNLNLASGYATAITLVIEQGATGYYSSAVQIDGNAVPLAWQGNTIPTPSSNRFDVVTFSILYDGLYTVLGQLTGF